MPALPEVELRPGTLAIGDLHLDVASEESRGPFLRWLESLRGDARPPRLIVVGDLFDYWVGPAQLERAREVVAGLAALVRAGTALDIVPGNRDFLLDGAFERATGARLRADGLVGRTAAGERVLFLHGDELSTLDRGYLRLRRVLRSGPVRWLAPRLPRSLAFAIAERLRRASRRAIAAKPSEEMAQQPAEVTTRARASESVVLVCGHAHRFRDEELSGGPRWIVLDAWGSGEQDLLEVTGPHPATSDLRARSTGVALEVAP